MSWLRIDDTFMQHPKFVGWTYGERWKFLELMGYCARYRTGGWVPPDVSLLPRAVTSQLVAKAVDSGWLDVVDDGYVVHDWKVYNPADSTAADRMRRYRARNVKRNEVRNGDVTNYPQAAPDERNDDRNDDRNETVTRARARARIPSPSTETSFSQSVRSELRGAEAQVDEDGLTDLTSEIDEQLQRAKEGSPFDA